MGDAELSLLRREYECDMTTHRQALARMIREGAQESNDSMKQLRVWLRSVKVAMKFRCANSVQTSLAKTIIRRWHSCRSSVEATHIPGGTTRVDSALALMALFEAFIHVSPSQRREYQTGHGTSRSPLDRSYSVVQELRFKHAGHISFKSCACSITKHANTQCQASASKAWKFSEYRD
jgi:hypothetical protein